MSSYRAPIEKKEEEEGKEEDCRRPDYSANHSRDRVGINEHSLIMSCCCDENLLYGECE